MCEGTVHSVCVDPLTEIAERLWIRKFYEFGWPVATQMIL